MSFQPIYNAFETRPKSQISKNPKGTQMAVIKDNFSITTWLLLGAMLQGFCCFLPYRNIALILPSVLLLSLRTIKPILMHFNIIANPYMDNVVHGLSVPVFPSADGIQDTPANNEILCLIIAVRSNSPLGIFGKGYDTIGDFFRRMVAELEADPARHGFLGASNWLNAGDRGVSSEFMAVMYFESSDALHAYAHGPLHVQAMEWWASTVKQNDHLAIMHEFFVAGPGRWEGVYVNYHPTGVNATFKQVEVKDEQGAREVWMSPQVEGKGVLRYSRGRMGKGVVGNEKELLDRVMEKASLEI